MDEKNENELQFSQPSATLKQSFIEKETLISGKLFIKISDAELNQTLPTKSETNKKLYNLIREKEKLLGDVHQKLSTVVSRNQEKSTNIETLKTELHYLTALTELQTNCLNQELETYDAKKKEAEKIEIENKLLLEKISKTKERVHRITKNIKKQKEYLDSLNEKVNERQKRKDFVNTKLDETQFLQENLNEVLRRDSKTVKELEIYLKKIIMHVYERQREVDLLKLGQLDSQTEAEGIRRVITLIDKKNSKFDNSTAEIVSVDDGPEMQKAFHKLSKLEAAIEANFLKMEQNNSKKQNLKIQWLNEVKKEISRLLESIKIKEQNKLLEKQINWFTKKIEIIKFTQPSSMYKNYQNAIETIQDNKSEVAEKMENEKLNVDTKFQQSCKQLMKLKKRFDKYSQLITQKKSIKPSNSMESIITEDDCRNSDSNESEDLTETESTSNSEREKIGKKMNWLKKHENEDNDESIFLEELNRKRKDILNECKKEVMNDLRKRKDQLRTDVRLLNAEVKIYCNEIEHYRASIQREVTKTNEISCRIRIIKENIAQRKAELKRKSVNQQTTAQMEAMKLDEQVKELNKSISVIEVKRNRLNSELIQAQVDENNLRNRFETYKSLRSSNNTENKEMVRLHRLWDEWKEKVENSQCEMQNLENFLKLTQQRNWPTRQKLAVAARDI